MKKIFFLLVAVLVCVAMGLFIWLRSSMPTYEGSLKLTGLEQPVAVHFDEFGVPHIEAKNNHDLFMAFGYVHAQERLFQMEMLRRAGSGRLAEIIGQPMIKVDRIFLTLGMREYAEASAARLEQQRNTPMYAALQAYIDGINYFIDHGPTPPEFSIIGITKRKFEPIDLYYITGAMAFNFGMAHKTEPVVDHIAKHYPKQHLEDIGLFHGNESAIPTTPHDSAFFNSIMQLAQAHAATESVMPFASLNGSNAWVVAGSKTKSGRVMVSNDTHIGYMMPQTWYEAHLKSPEFEMYGHYLAGVPFAMIGRDQYKAWGVTMLLNDDMDFFAEQPSAGDSTLFLYEGNYEACTQRKYSIPVKGSTDTIIQVRVTRHGPIINDIFKSLPDHPVSAQWAYTLIENKNLEALWQMNTAHEIATFTKAISEIHAPGLSINYGDAQGHIAWWAAARFVQRPDSMNSWTILDGSKASNDWIGYYPFEMNPRCIDPAHGFIYSANDWPDDVFKYSVHSTVKPLFYPGYYKPQYRADRIRALLEPENSWTLDKMKTMINDSRSVVDAAIMKRWVETFEQSELNGDEDYLLVKPYLQWDGEYQPTSVGPTLFNRLLYQSMRLALQDEMGDKLFNLFLTTHQFQRAIQTLNDATASPWWDNVRTPERETYNDIMREAFRLAYAELEEEFGKNPGKWTWDRSAYLEIKHPLGEVALLRPLFSLGKRPVWGGNETVHQSGFYPDSTCYAKIFFGSQMRTMFDFGDFENGVNITPSGQSGHVMSEHYDDQAALYAHQDFRKQYMTVNPSWRMLRLTP